MTTRSSISVNPRGRTWRIPKLLPVWRDNRRQRVTRPKEREAGEVVTDIAAAAPVKAVSSGGSGSGPPGGNPVCPFLTRRETTTRLLRRGGGRLLFRGG